MANQCNLPTKESCNKLVVHMATAMQCLTE